MPREFAATLSPGYVTHVVAILSPGEKSADRIVKMAFWLPEENRIFSLLVFNP